MKTLSQRAFYTTTAGGVTSTSPAAPPSDSERLARIEAMVEEQKTMVEEMFKRLCPDRDNGTGPVSLERAIREFGRGNRKPLQNFKRRGGKILAKS